MSQKANGQRLIDAMATTCAGWIPWAAPRTFWRRSTTTVSFAHKRLGRASLVDLLPVKSLCRFACLILAMQSNPLRLNEARLGAAAWCPN